MKKLICLLIVTLFLIGCNIPINNNTIIVPVKLETTEIWEGDYTTRICYKVTFDIKERHGFDIIFRRKHWTLKNWTISELYGKNKKTIESFIGRKQRMCVNKYGYNREFRLIK